MNILPYELSPLPYLMEVIQLGTLAICPMLLASGLVFPLLLRRAAAIESGRQVGVLLAWNGLGGWLGAELGQAVLAPLFGLWQSVVAVAAGYAVLCVIYDLRITRRSDPSPQVVNRMS